MNVFKTDALANRVVLITGASRGIGAGILEFFVQAGATVIGTATSESGAQRITEKIAELGGQGKGLVVNVNDEGIADATIGQIVREFGHIDILINNAGITRDTLVMRMKDEQWDEVLQTNLTAAFRFARACVRPMMRARFGRIINITSVVGAMGNPGQVNYAAAKAGMIGMTKALAREIGSRNITVNCIAPGFIETDMTRALSDDVRAKLIEQVPLASLGQVEDIANACLYLASDAGRYVTGSTLHVNGGMYMG